MSRLNTSPDSVLQPAFSGLQYLRGICALAVVIDHASGLAAFDKYFGQVVFGGFLHSGARGVDVFFVISGFVIHHASMRAGELGSSGHGRAFLVRRFFRIVPLLWICVISYALMRFAATGQFDFVKTLTSALLLPFGEVSPEQIWTLRHEFIFYLVFALTYLSGGLKFRFWVLAAWLSAPFAYFLLGLPEKPKTSGLEVLWIVGNPVNIEFGAGLLVGHLYGYGYLTRTRNLLSKLDPVLSFWLMIVLFLLQMVADHFAVSRLTYLESKLILAVFSGAIVVVSLQSTLRNPFWHPTLLYMGSASYAIYLFHMHVLSGSMSVGRMAFGKSSFLFTLVFAVLAATIAGLAIHKYVERPLLVSFRKGRGL